MEEPILVDPADTTIEVVRNFVQYAYPGVLLLSFLLVGALDSISSALRKEEVVVATVRGPGGKPLPVTKRRKDTSSNDDDDRPSPRLRAFFQYSMLAATVTFLVVGADIAHRALWNRSIDGEHGWWCGEPKTVSNAHWMLAMCGSCGSFQLTLH